MLYTITFKSGAQQEFELDNEAVIQLMTGFRSVNEGRARQDGILGKGDAAILLSEVAAFGPYISMAQRYGSKAISHSE